MKKSLKQRKKRKRIGLEKNKKKAGAADFVPLHQPFFG